MPRISLGLASVNIQLFNNPFLDVMKTADRWAVRKTGSVLVSQEDLWGGDYLDANGDMLQVLPSDTVDYFIYINADPAAGTNTAGYNPIAGREFRIVWDGSGTVSAGLFTSASVTNASSGFATLTINSDGGGLILFSSINVNDAPRNIRCYETQFETEFNNGDIFRPDWLEQVSKFAILRTMDWQSTNWSGHETIADLADFDWYRWGKPHGDGYWGPKFGMPMEVIAELANATGRDVHVCFPHHADDTLMTQMAETLRDGITGSSKVYYEYSNECWNNGFGTNDRGEGQFTYLNALNDGTFGINKSRAWYGYKACNAFNLVRQAYGSDRHRWRGVIGTQTVAPEISDNALMNVGNHGGTMGGLERFLDDNPTLVASDVIDELAVTGYFGDVFGGSGPENITQSSTPVVTLTGHGRTTGQEFKFFINSGMVELDGQYSTITVVNANSFTLDDIDTSTYTAYSADNQNFFLQGEVFRLFEASTAANLHDSATYPTKYTLYETVMKASWLTGTGSWASGPTWDAGTYLTSENIDELETNYWPAQKVIADSLGLDLTQYEGGSHSVGNIFWAGSGGIPEYVDFFTNTGHNQSIADCYTEMYEAFLRAGGVRPSKFVEMGYPSPYGTWGGIRHMPGDEGNPVWQATVNFSMADEATRGRSFTKFR